MSISELFIALLYFCAFRGGCVSLIHPIFIESLLCVRYMSVYMPIQTWHAYICIYVWKVHMRLCVCQQVYEMSMTILT